MKQSHIHLLGTAGEDPREHERLQKALQMEKPDVITVNASPQLVKYVDTDWLSDSLKRLNGYKGIKPKVKSTIEHMIRNIYSSGVTVSRDYAVKNNVPIHFIGDSLDYITVKSSLTSPHQQSKVDQINEYQTMEKLLSLTENMYNTFQMWFSNPDWVSTFMMHDYVQRFLPDQPERELVTAENLRKLAYQVCGKIVHVTCLDVLTDDARGQSLYERIRDLQPTRGTIADY